MSWIDTLLQETDFVETPRQWITWSGIAAISAVVSPNIYVNKGAYKLKPNIYVMLIGRSGLGKGFGPSLAAKMVGMVNNTRVIQGSGSIEGLIHELSIVKAAHNGSIPYKDARAFICSGEFADSFVDPTKALTRLMNLYDGHYTNTWENVLKHSPKEPLKDVCITLLSGANPDMFDMAIDRRHRSGGFIGRTCLIGAEKRAKHNSMIYTEDEVADEVNVPRLADYLYKLSKLEGKMKWSYGAKERYNEWFYPFRAAESMGIEDTTGTYDRLNDHMIKVITCVSLARNTDMILEAEDVDLALELCSPLSNQARKTAGMQGKSIISVAIKSFLMIMLSAEKYTLTRKQVLQKGFGDFDSTELDKIIETLTQTGFLTQPTGGKEVSYRLTKLCLEKLKPTLMESKEKD